MSSSQRGEEMHNSFGSFSTYSSGNVAGLRINHSELSLCPTWSLYKVPPEATCVFVHDQGHDDQRPNISGLQHYGVCCQKDPLMIVYVCVYVCVRSSVSVFSLTSAVQLLTHSRAAFHVAHGLIGLTDNFNETLPLPRCTPWL